MGFVRFLQLFVLLVVSFSSKVDDNNDQFMYAASHNNLMQNGISPNVENEQGWTPLIFGVNGGHVEIVKLLLGSGAAVNKEEKDGWIPLFFAVARQQKEMVELLVNSGADINHSNVKGLTVWSLLKNTPKDEEIREILLRQGRGRKVSEDQKTESLLGESIENRRLTASDVEWEETQAKEEVEPEISDEEARAAKSQLLLDFAVVGNLEQVKSLLISGADVRFRNSAGWTPLLFAAHAGHLEMCRFLINAGADVNAEENDGWTAVMFAAAQGFSLIVKLLLKSGAHILHTSGKGVTVPGSAVIGGNKALAAELADQALDEAMAEGRKDRYLELVVQGADPNKATETGNTPLLSIVSTGDVKAVQDLLKLGALVDKEERDGWTPLMAACATGQTEVSKVLLEAGAKVLHVSLNGQTPRSVAERNGDVDLIKLIAAYEEESLTHAQSQSEHSGSTGDGSNFDSRQNFRSEEDEQSANMAVAEFLRANRERSSKEREAIERASLAEDRALSGEIGQVSAGKKKRKSKS